MSHSKVVTAINPLPRGLKGVTGVPGDKSISHRSVLFAAMGDGVSNLSGVLDSEDVRSSMRAVSQLGACVNLEKQPDGSLAGAVEGWGQHGPSQPDEPIDCGNSGTTVRLLMGILAPWNIRVELTGDASLQRRPMRRITAPLTQMGARFEPEGKDTLPLVACGNTGLQAVTYDSPVASAQLKTAVLLAGLQAQGTTTVNEPSPSRNHTELMLPEFGVETYSAQLSASVVGPAKLSASDVCVPGDPSSAAFLACAAVLKEHSDIEIQPVSLNEARIGFVHVLEDMGADVRISQTGAAGKEPFGVVYARYTPDLQACEVSADKIASLVDEIPVLSLVAAHAKGVTIFREVDELRVKETDRLTAIIDGLAILGIKAWTQGNDLYIEGQSDLSVQDIMRFDSLGDHRLAMTWALVGLCDSCAVEVEDFEAVKISYPGFLNDIERLTR